MMEDKGRSRRWVKPLIAVVLIGLFVLLIIVRLGAKKADQAVTQESLQPVEVASVTMQPFSEELSVAGTVTAFAEAKVSPKVMGRVSALNAVVGQRVGQGDVLLVVDQGDYLAAVRQYEASLAMAMANTIQVETGYDNARINYQRNEELYKQGAISISKLEEARGQLATAESSYKSNQAQISQYQAMLDKARADYENTQIRAPFAGAVAKRLVEVGEMVSQQTPVYIVIQDDPLLVKVNLPENAVTKVSRDQQVDIYIGATGKTYKGSVNSISPQADSQNKAFAVEIKLTGAGEEVRPGMVAELRLKTRQVDSALVVPTDALLEEDTGAGLFVVENDVARHRKVTTGLVGQGYTQVTSGLQQGDQIIVRGNHLLVDGMKVRVEGTRKESTPPQAGGESR